MVTEECLGQYHGGFHKGRSAIEKLLVIAHIIENNMSTASTCDKCLLTLGKPTKAFIEIVFII